MTRDSAGALIRNDWWKVVGLVAALALAIGAAREHEITQDDAIAGKADSAQVAKLTATVERLDNRLRSYLCDGKPDYCQ